MATSNQEEPTLVSTLEVNYHVVYSPNSKSFLYVGYREDCERYIRQTELEGCEIWHIHDLQFHAKPVYICNQE
jgi:hypothetical protein